MDVQRADILVLAASRHDLAPRPSCFLIQGSRRDACRLQLCAISSHSVWSA